MVSANNLEVYFCIFTKIKELIRQLWKKNSFCLSGLPKKCGIITVKGDDGDVKINSSSNRCERHETVNRLAELEFIEPSQKGNLAKKRGRKVQERG